MSNDSTKRRWETRWFGMWAKMPAQDGTGLKWRAQWRRIFGVSGGVAAAGYLLVVSGGYLWLSQVRGIDQIRFLDVATANVPAVKRSIAANHLETARTALKTGNLQTAYLSFISALRGDGTNASVRLEVADFLLSIGASKQALSVLEDGAKQAPQNTTLVLRLFETLRAQGRGARLLELLKGPLKSSLNTSAAAEIHLMEAESLLEVSGGTEALAIFDRYPAINVLPRAAEIKALALWTLGKRVEGTGVLRDAFRQGNDRSPLVVRLFEFLEFQGQTYEAASIANEAATRKPTVMDLRLLAIAAARAPRSAPTADWAALVRSYLLDFGGDGAAVVALAELGARRGWFDLTEGLFAAALEQGPAVRIMALAHADALLRAGYPERAAGVLQDLEPQLGGDTAASIALRRRQIAVAASTGAELQVREYARSLASLLSSDQERLELTRRQFEQAGLTAAAVELRGAGARLAKPTPRPQG